MQAIQTKYIPPTNSRGPRYGASCESARISISGDSSLDYEANHKLAAVALLKKLGWDTLDGAWHCGFFNGNGYHVFVEGNR